MDVWMIRNQHRAFKLLLLLPWMSCVLLQTVGETVQFQSNEILLTVYRDEEGIIKGCHVVQKRNRPQTTSRSEVSLNEIPVSEEFVTFMVGFCGENYPIRHKQIRQKRQLIYPGTKWCGVGNVASDDNDLGALVATDTCCREHDKCNVTIGPKEMKGGLKNDDTFTKVSCLCEAKFRECLKAAEKQGEKEAGDIGALYFNFLKQNCIVIETPLLVCQKWLQDICLHKAPDTKNELIFRLVESHLKY